jgi:hypothetical protein
VATKQRNTRAETSDFRSVDAQSSVSKFSQYILPGSSAPLTLVGEIKLINKKNKLRDIVSAKQFVFLW